MDHIEMTLKNRVLHTSVTYSADPGYVTCGSITPSKRARREKPKTLSGKYYKKILRSDIKPNIAPVGEFRLKVMHWSTFHKAISLHTFYRDVLSALKYRASLRCERFLLHRVSLLGANAPHSGSSLHRLRIGFAHPYSIE